MSLYSSARSGIGGERHGESRVQQLVASPRLKEQLFVRGQSGGMSQQHADGHFVAAGIFFGIASEFREDGGERARQDQAGLVDRGASPRAWLQPPW